MTEKELNTLWDYYLTIDKDLANTARYVEPAGQEKVYSFEFEKIIILACSEIEKVIKILAKETKGVELGNMREYKDFFKNHCPEIVNVEVIVRRLGRNIKPFEDWFDEKLKWWIAYTDLKHESNKIKSATVINAIYSVGALYLLILYLSKITKIDIPNHKSEFIDSEYGVGEVVFNSAYDLPGFEK